MDRSKLTLPFLLAIAVCLQPRLANASDVDPFANDTRLDRQAAMSVEGMAIADLFTLLSKKTGVSLSAARDVGDEKIVLFTPARSLRTTLKDVATLFGCRWDRGTIEGQATYTLSRGAELVKYETALRQRANNLMLAKLEAQVRALDESAEQLASRGEADEIHKRLSNPDSRLATEFYRLLSAAQKRELFSLGRYRIAFSALPENYRQTLREMAERSVRANLAGVDLGARSVDDYVRHDRERLEATGAQFKLMRTPRRNFTTVWLSLGAVGGSVVAELTESGQWQLPPHGNPYPAAVRQIGEAPTTSLQISVNSKPAQLAAGALPDEKFVRAASLEKAYVDRAKKLSRSSGQPVLGDYYRTKVHVNRQYPQDPPEQSAQMQALNELSGKQGSLWWFEGKTIFFRSRNWYERRLYEVPDRWYRNVAAKLKSQKGKPVYNDMQTIAELTPLQIHGLMSGHRESGDLMFKTEFDVYFQPGLHELLALLKPKPWPFGRNDEILIGRVPDAQMKRATLTWELMTPTQRTALPAFLSAQDELVANAPADSFTVFIRRGNASEVAETFVSIGIVCELKLRGEDDTFFDKQAHYDIFLPLVLPDDRSSALSIELSAPAAEL
jgi:hypothetical protein